VEENPLAPSLAIQPMVKARWFANFAETKMFPEHLALLVIVSPLHAIGASLGIQIKMRRKSLGSFGSSKA
jgi:hypothetical protein